MRGTTAKCFRVMLLTAWDSSERQIRWALPSVRAPGRDSGLCGTAVAPGRILTCPARWGEDGRSSSPTAAHARPTGIPGTGSGPRLLSASTCGVRTESLSCPARSRSKSPLTASQARQPPRRATLSRTAQLVAPGPTMMKRSCPPGATATCADAAPEPSRCDDKRRETLSALPDDDAGEFLVKGQDAAEDTPEAIWPPWHVRYASPEPQGQSSSSATVRAGGNQPAAAEPCA
jgi:hypothetical protein